MTLEEAIAALKARATQSVPFAGEALGSLQRGASYAAAKAGTLGVETFWSGGKLRTSSIAIARQLGVEDAVAPAMTEQRGKVSPPSAAPPPAKQLAASPKPAPSRSRKSPTPKALAARKPAASAATAQPPDRRRSRQAEPAA